MYLCYVDESGTAESHSSGTSHFVLAGISIPIARWAEADREISTALAPYDLSDTELHTAFMLRPYRDQAHVPHFESLDRAERRAQVLRYRQSHLTRLGGRRSQRLGKTRNDYKRTLPYIHLTLAERRRAVRDVAEVVASWSDARLFAECIDKHFFDPARTYPSRSANEQAFEQVVSRFEQYLNNVSTRRRPAYGLVAHDNNQTVARRHTRMMRNFHAQGTFWTNVRHIIETPMFVDSELTRMIQIADLCAYALRRYVERGETELFDPIFTRADRVRGATVGVRHYSPPSCDCIICRNHSS